MTLITGTERGDEPATERLDSSACQGVKTLYIGLRQQNINPSELLTERNSRVRGSRKNGKQASDAETHRLTRLTKQDNLSRPVSLMTRIVPDALNYSEQQQRQLIRI